MISKRLALLVIPALTAGTLVLGPVSPAEAALPLCVEVRETRVGKIVPTTRGGSPNCLIGDGLAGCGGSNCTAIAQLQHSLRRCNGQQVSADGWWGPQTRRAVRNVQRDRGIAVDGIYGPATRNAMKHLPSCKRY